MTGECHHGSAEREAAVYAEGLCPICLQAALAAERKDHTERMNSVQDFYSRQLAAERERVGLLAANLKGIQESLKEADPVSFKGTISMIDDALAKVT